MFNTYIRRWARVRRTAWRSMIPTHAQRPGTPGKPPEGWQSRGGRNAQV